MAQDKSFADQQRKVGIYAVAGTVLQPTAAPAGCRAALQPPADYEQACESPRLPSGEYRAAPKSAGGAAVRHESQQSWSIPSAQQQLLAVLEPQRLRGNRGNSPADPLALPSMDASIAARFGPGTESLDELIAALRAEQGGGDSTLACMLTERHPGACGTAEQVDLSRLGGGSRGGGLAGVPRGQRRQWPPIESGCQLQQRLPDFDPTEAEKQLKAKLQQAGQLAESLLQTQACTEDCMQGTKA